MGEYSKYYDKNVAILKKYGNDYKLIRMNAVRKKGIEIKGLDDIKKERGTINNEKLENNISRAKQKIFEYAKCNVWNWFCTLTLDSKKYDRDDLKTYIKDLGEFIHSQNRRRKAEDKIKYLIIPEQHKNGAWHLHALFNGLKPGEMARYQKSDFKDGKIPNYIRKHLDNNTPLYRWDKYTDRFGYCLIDEVQNADAISAYVVKYINKDMASSVTELNSKLYYCSKGLKKAEEIKRGRFLYEGDLTADYENEYCKINWLTWMAEPKEAELLIEDNRELVRNCKNWNMELEAHIVAKERQELEKEGYRKLKRIESKAVESIFNKDSQEMTFKEYMFQY